MATESTSILITEPAVPSDYLSFLEEQPGGGFECLPKCRFELVVALAAKGFVILTGQSGTGKSRSGIELGQCFDSLPEFDNGEHGSCFELVPVAGDWTDSRPLLGYASPFGQERVRADGSKTNETYEVTKTLRLLLRAAAPGSANLPHMLILDEMNLSHVERYFSPFLSLIEANRSAATDNAIPLLLAEEVRLIADVLEDTEPNSPEADAAEELRADGRGLPVPQNLVVVGTVNVDETTYMFSPKVLDRAHVVELRLPRPAAYFDGEVGEEETLSPEQALNLLKWAIEQRKHKAFDQKPAQVLDSAREFDGISADDLEKLKRAVRSLLDGCSILLDPIGFGFGYRVVNEICGYLVCWLKAQSLTGGGSASWPNALDRVLLQKVLPRIHGNRRQLGDSLAALSAFLGGHHGGSTPAAKFRFGDATVVEIKPEGVLFLGEDEQMARSRNKLERMQMQLRATGYATFIQ